jgi:hypothetical protein
LQDSHQNLPQLAFSNPTLSPRASQGHLIRSSGFKEDGVQENKLKRIFVGVLQDLAGQGFRKDA